jgi:hypothetical protein
MDFLTPGPDYHDHVILVLIVVTGQRSKIYRYSWNFAKPPLQTELLSTHPLGSSELNGYLRD